MAGTLLLYTVKVSRRGLDELSSYIKVGVLVKCNIQNQINQVVVLHFGRLESYSLCALFASSSFERTAGRTGATTAYTAQHSRRALDFSHRPFLACSEVNWHLFFLPHARYDGQSSHVQPCSQRLTSEARYAHGARRVVTLHHAVYTTPVKLFELSPIVNNTSSVAAYWFRVFSPRASSYFSSLPCTIEAI